MKTYVGTRKGNNMTTIKHTAEVSKRKKYKTYILVELKGSGPFVDKLVSVKPISFERACNFVEKKYDVDWERDSATLIEKPEVVNMDKGGE